MAGEETSGVGLR